MFQLPILYCHFTVALLQNWPLQHSLTPEAIVVMLYERLMQDEI
jgi:hypothetical protein